MDVSQIFATKYLAAADLQGREPTVIIQSVEPTEMEKDGRSERKLLVFFEGKQKGLVLNKTNATTIVELYGNETDHWIGKAIKLVTARVDFQGRRVSAIRIDPPDRTRAVATPGLREHAPPPPPPPPPQRQASAPAPAGHPDFVDEIPFAPNFM